MPLARSGFRTHFAVKTLYLDIFSGLSGDMFIGAMLDLGMGLDHLERELAKLRLDGYHLHASRAKRFQIEGTKFDVHLGHHHPHTHENEQGHEHEAEHSHAPEHGHEHGHTDEHGHKHEHGHSHEDKHEHGRAHAEIRQLISASSLSPWVKAKAVAVFQRLAVAEGKIHGLPAEQVHFHEVGAVDSIVDIVGACVALEFFGQPEVLASPVVDGSGWIDCAHGRFPIPAPATLEILAARGVLISQCEEPHELVTPTGAALLAEFAAAFGPMQGLAPERIGFGVGQRENKTRPNVVRAILGRSGAAAVHDWETDTVAVLETNLDDANPEWIGNFVDKAMSAGALDVFQTPIHMKKNRPGVLLSVICIAAEADQFSEWMLRHTSAFGVRRTLAERRKLRREFRAVPTPFGEVSVKIGKLDGRVIQTAPEYESCKRLAEEKGVPLKTIYEAALAAVHLEAGPPPQ
jgi:pyridinium-3,5-bisthiocarboxylic acid mononucleotide nickel chelatase